MSAYELLKGSVSDHGSCVSVHIHICCVFVCVLCTYVLCIIGCFSGCYSGTTCSTQSGVPRYQ